ncbi:MAG TPA: MmgE/PrpD family protein [Anaerolineae bacterium]|nr:MmgE/PrpD family protein [Anaerolineae bacterium]
MRRDEVSTKKTISEQIAELAVNLRYDDLPEEARKHAANLVLDLLGSMIGSKNIESSKMATELALELGGPEESTIVGYDRKVAAPNAAFANAIQGYAFDFADDHNESNAHPSVATIPASLALGQKLHASGKEVIEAIALGNEVVCRLGAAFLGKSYYQGFHPSSTCGTFGATISAAKLLRLDFQKMVWSQGIAGSQVGGLMAWNTSGSYTKRLQAGHPAMVGIISALLAQKGFNGPPEIIEGMDGFMQAYSFNREYDTGYITNDLGKVWTFAKSSIKVYPCCRYSAGHLDACLDIVAKYHPDPRKIKQVLIRSSDYTIRLLAAPRKRDPQTVVDAQFSMPWQAAIALIDGKIVIDTFTEKNLHRPDVRELMTRIEWVVDEEFERRYPEHHSSAVTVTMEDGEEYTSVVDDPKGDFRNPVTQKEIEDKFVNLAQREIADEDKIQRIVAFVKDIHQADDINELFALIA